MWKISAVGRAAAQPISGWWNRSVYLRATVFAVAPFMVGCVSAIAWVGRYSPEIADKTVFQLQKWLIAGFFLNAAIIVCGTAIWAIVELATGKNDRQTMRFPLAVLTVGMIFLCAGEWKEWSAFIKGDCAMATCEMLLHERLHASEWTSFQMFVLFLVVDFLAYRGLRGLANPSPAEVHDRNFFKRCIWIVDLPVVIIVSIVLVSRAFVFDEPGRVTEHGSKFLGVFVNIVGMDTPPLSSYGNMIGDSFAVGAILGHIMLSQLAFTYLKWESYVDSARAKMSSATP